jgi:hypothetical protein
VLAHAVIIVLLVWLERRAPRRAAAPALQYVSIWPEQRREPELRPIARTPKPMTRASQLQTRPLTSETPNPPQQEKPTDPVEQLPQPPIDWNAASTAAAAGFAGNTGGERNFSPTPRAMRKPCKQRKFDAETQNMMAERLPPPPDPDPVGPTPTANCIVVGGYPKCVQKIRIRPRSSLISTERLEERLADRTSVPSVPSPDLCD